jgi:hypothetical protein
VAAASEKINEVPPSPSLFASAGPSFQRLPYFDMTDFDPTRSPGVLPKMEMSKVQPSWFNPIVLLVTEEPKQFILLRNTKSLFAQK